ncbi:multicopper oxidase domain-containing protein, partial [Mesorhizobium sp. M2D.F.Ca.ET.147.01.1.1]
MTSITTISPPPPFSSTLLFVVWKAQRPGKWLIHCHIPHHTTN